MKKFILQIIIFFFIVIAIDFGFGKVCDYMNAHSKGGLSKQTYDLCMKDEYDLIVMGSSRAHHHYVPKIFEDSLGASCYNAGYDGNGIILMYGIYQMIKERYRPQLIIYDIEESFDVLKYANDNNRTRYLATLRPYCKNDNIRRLFKDISKEEYYKTFSSLCKYNSVSLSLLMDYIKPRPIANKGYSPLRGEILIEPEKKPFFENPVEDSVKLRYMSYFISDVSKNHIPIIVVASPKYGADNSEVFTSIKEICQEYNVPFVDFYADSLFMSHKDWFKEPMHLNDEGARMFTLKIVDIIKQKSEFVISSTSFQKGNI